MLRKYLCLLLAVQAVGNGLGPSLALAAQMSERNPGPMEVLVDGKSLKTEEGGFQVPASHKSVSVRVGKLADDRTEGSRRIRFKLDGIDNDWREMPSEMCLTVRFFDAVGDQVGQQIFQVSGKSAGWEGTIESSRFTQREESVRVPEAGAFLTVTVTSSGPPTAVGVYVVESLRVFRAGSGDAKPLVDTDAAADHTSTVPQGWSRSGTRPSMARMIRVGNVNAFCIVDDDPNAHAEWSLSRAAAPKVQPGELIKVEWTELYNIATGQRFEVNYGRLNAGNYRFWAGALDPMGSALGAPRSIEFAVLQPFWKSVWFWIGGAALLGLLIWLVCRAIIRQRIRQHLARVEREHLIERERLRIAQDLHDDLGARVTHISLVSGLAENDPQSAAARESFQRISGMARDLVAALYETVWTVNPENDDLEAVVNYLCQLTQGLCEAAGIRCRIHSCQVPSERRVTSEIRHDITLAVKEAVHNAIKHAHATEIVVGMDFSDPRLTITIADNGRGFDPAAVERGNGLANMRRRAESIGGTFSVEKVTEGGTRIRFDVPILAGAKSPSRSQTAASR